MQNAQKIMRILRESKDYSQEYVANKLDMHQRTYSNLESGKTKLTIDRIKELAEFYQVEPDYFLSDELPIINYNTGKKSNSNSGYIKNYISDSGNKELYERLIDEKTKLINDKDEQILILKELLQEEKEEKSRLLNLLENINTLANQ